MLVDTQTQHIQRRTHANTRSITTTRSVRSKALQCIKFNEIDQHTRVKMDTCVHASRQVHTRERLYKQANAATVRHQNTVVRQQETHHIR